MKRSGILHIQSANYCWFADPAKALCLKLAGDSTATQPLAGLCDAVRCPQATFHAHHRDAWAGRAESTTTFLGNPRIPAVEKPAWPANTTAHNEFWPRSTRRRPTTKNRMTISEVQRRETENRIRAAIDRLQSGNIPAGGSCDIKTLAREAGVSRAAVYRSFHHLKAEFEETARANAR